MIALPPTATGLRRGITTGSCAAAAAKAAACLLREEAAPATAPGSGGSRDVEIRTPAGIPLLLTAEILERSAHSAACGVRKDAGDDPDITDGMLIVARVTKRAAPGIRVGGGAGVGRVTKPGLDRPVGAAAINSVPLRMIEQAVREALPDQATGLDVLIEIPGGEEAAKRTFNGELGIVGGLSVLGTTGIVEPMSEAALVATIRAALSVLRASGADTALAVPGNYGTDFLKAHFGADPPPFVKCSNFVGDTLGLAAELGFARFVYIAHIGKFVKVAAGQFQTHSKYGDGRMEVLEALARQAGADAAQAQDIQGSVTAEGAAALLADFGLLDAVGALLTGEVQARLEARAAGRIQVGCGVYTQARGLLSLSEAAQGMLPVIQ
ncbi:MAG: cobalt-precorrin-5B (C(1))-methyltransferase CbiD [Clostridiales Family XIII bacterium]|jgi:cobalt-precorrin-5B (C1)-methyltransferase|nr:cobalt-precorrin-5B (C(1))-methyltransferase CbiD [Clostridiales Family XIII bacterium]